MILILIIILCLHFTKENFSHIKPDIVITWVEDNDDFEKDLLYWAKVENEDLGENRNRFTDHQELKYCLRSIEKYFPDYNMIYIIVKDGQSPPYLKKNNNKLKFITHSQIIPSKFLPTFNSFSIECFLHHIPNLSEYYIYFNDDFMLLKDKKMSFFIDDKNLPYNLITEDDKYSCNNEYVKLDSYDFTDAWCNNNLFLDKIFGITENRFFLSHVPKIYRKSYDFEIERLLKNTVLNDNFPNINAFDKTAMSKFRKNDNLFLNVVIKYYFYAYLFNSSFKKTKCLDLVIHDTSDINPGDNDFLCVNDVYEDVIPHYFKSMDSLFPTKSSFEI
jgi:hypothetical protein